MSEPRIIHDLTFAEYQALPGLNSSTLKWGTVSMKHLKCAVDGLMDAEDSRDRKFGRAVHCRILEPERYKQDVLIAGRCSARLKSGKNKGELCGNQGSVMYNGVWYCNTKGHAIAEATAPEEFVSKDESKRIEDMAASLHEHEVMQLFRREGWSEVSVTWQASGLDCKARLDKFTLNGPMILDIKKCQVGRGDNEQCSKSILNYGWHRQAAMYVDAVAACGHPGAEFVWVFIEDGPPYDVNVIKADAETLSIGRFEYRQILDNWKISNRQEKYSGYVYSLQRIVEGGLPGWYRRQYESINVDASFRGDDRILPGTEDHGDYPSWLDDPESVENTF